jgi:hypothetical protein
MTWPRVPSLVFLVLALHLSSHAFCPTDVVILKGRVDHAPRNAVVRVQLIYAKQKAVDSGETTVEDGRFRLQIPFDTESHAPVLVGSLHQKCNRKPISVVVTLMKGEEEIDRVALDFVKDFEVIDPSAYSVRSDVVLHGNS